jgi:hypothetical protein
VGVETFSFAPAGDSVVVTSHARQVYPAPDGGPDTLLKDMQLVVGARDWNVLGYESQQVFQGHTVRRGLVLDGLGMTSYLQVDERGTGDRLERPPGRMFVLDPQIFALYDVLCRNLHRQTFEQRPVTLFALGKPDTLMEVTARDLGSETIQWGARPVKTRKISISDSGMEFFVWISPTGNMLRLEQPEFGMRVERRESVKPASRRSPRDG